MAKLEFLVAAFLVKFLAVFADPDPLQDTCVADYAGITLNGYTCKNESLLTAEDFIFHDLAKPANTSFPPFAAAVFGTVDEFPGLNTQGISVARLDFAKGGLIPPHVHPRGTEFIYVVHGSLYAGFVTTDNRIFAKVIHEGDVMLFPRGLVHWQLNVGESSALGIVSLNSQKPGFQLVANSMFGSNIPDEVLVKTFFIDQQAVKKLKDIFGSTN